MKFLLLQFSQVLALAVALPAVLFAVQPLAPGEVQTVLQLSNGEHPEGIAIDKDGTIYVGNRRINSENRKLGEILKIENDGSVKLYAELPTVESSAEGLLGLAFDSEGDLFAALVAFDPDTRGVYRISHGGASVTRLTGSGNIAFPNGLIFDDDGQLYVTDSFPGKIWRFANKHATASLWIQDALLQPFPTDPLGVPLPGANGIALVRNGQDREIFVANTEKGLIVCIPIMPDGSPGLPQILSSGIQILTVDGIAADPHGDIHAVIPGFSLLGTHPLVKVGRSTGDITPEVTDAAAIAKFDVPLSVAVGNASDTGTVFITNGDLAVAPGGTGPGVVQVGLDRK